MKTICRVLGALLMGAGGFLLTSTLLSLGALFAESKAPLWLTAAVALVFLGLYALLCFLGWRLWKRGRKLPEEKDGESEPEAGESKAAAAKNEPEEPAAAAEEKEKNE